MTGTKRPRPSSSQPPVSVSGWPDFSAFTYTIVQAPRSPRLQAWEKVKECERRLAVFEWAEGVIDSASASNRILLDDSLSAFLLTFEAAIQFTKGQFKQMARAPRFDPWLQAHASYDIDAKGARTLRHFAAHVQVMRAPSTVSVSVGGTMAFAGTPPPPTPTVISRKWLLPQISLADLARLTSRPLSSEELPLWNSTVTTSDALAVLRAALSQLSAIAMTAEGIV